MSDMLDGDAVAVDLALRALTAPLLRKDTLEHLALRLPAFSHRRGSSTVSAPAKNYRLTSMLSQGSYGSVHLLDDGSVMKLALSDDEHDDAMHASLLNEALLHIFMQCLRSRYTCAPLPFPIPRIHALGWIVETKSPAIVMEAAGASLYSALRTLSEVQLERIILCVCFHLLCLQRAFGFVHKDLHARNVMVRRRLEPLDATLVCDGDEARVRLDYDVFFIDFGTTCLNTRACATCRDEADVFRGMNPIYSALEFDAVQMMRSDGCSNASFDLRMLLGSLLKYAPPARHPNVHKWLRSMLDPETFPAYHAADQEWQELYRASSVVHPHLYPQAVFQSLNHRRDQAPLAAAAAAPEVAAVVRETMAEADAREAAEAKAEEEAYAAAVTAAMAAMEKRRAENLEMIRGMKRKRGALAGGALAGGALAGGAIYDGAIDAAYFGISSDATAAAT
jgi:hypothetical protein